MPANPAWVSDTIAINGAYCSLPSMQSRRPQDYFLTRLHKLHFRYSPVLALSTLRFLYRYSPPKTRFLISG